MAGGRGIRGGRCSEWYCGPGCGLFEKGGWWRVFGFLEGREVEGAGGLFLGSFVLWFGGQGLGFAPWGSFVSLARRVAPWLWITLLLGGVLSVVSVRFLVGLGQFKIATWGL